MDQQAGSSSRHHRQPITHDPTLTDHRGQPSQEPFHPSLLKSKALLFRNLYLLSKTSPIFKVFFSPLVRVGFCVSLLATSNTPSSDLSKTSLLAEIDLRRPALPIHRRLIDKEEQTKTTIFTQYSPCDCL